MFSESCRANSGSLVASSTAGIASSGRTDLSASSAAPRDVKMKVNRLDHLVLTVKDMDASCRFYTQVLGMELVKVGPEPRFALLFGEQKINLHPAGNEFELKAHRDTPGSADLCFVTDISLDEAKIHVESLGVNIIEGPVLRSGATGQILSIYFRDPDLNLIEVSNYV